MGEQLVTAMSVKIIAEITSYEDGQFCGTLDSIHFKEPLKFSGFVNMIEMMETTFDTLGFPDKSLLPRTFGKAKARMRRHEMDLEKLVAARLAGEVPEEPGGRMGTFEIYVSYRHNAEWQGKLHWVQKGVTKEFSSIVDMVKLLDEALAS